MKYKIYARVSGKVCLGTYDGESRMEAVKEAIEDFWDNEIDYLGIDNDEDIIIIDTVEVED